MEEAWHGDVNGVVAGEHGDIRGDEKNIAILLFLYLMQGIPLGLCSAIPMLLQNRGVSYKQQVRAREPDRRLVSFVMSIGTSANCRNVTFEGIDV